MKPLDKHEFGSTKAAVTLAAILSEHGNPSMRANVSRYLAHTNKLIKDVADIADVRSRFAVYNLIHDRIKFSNFGHQYPSSVGTYTRNVAMSAIKRAKEKVVTENAVTRSNQDRERSLSKNKKDNK